MPEPPLQRFYSGYVICSDDFPMRGTVAFFVGVGLARHPQRDGNLVGLQRHTRVRIYASHKVVNYPIAVHFIPFMAGR